MTPASALVSDEQGSTVWNRARDLFALTKPRVTVVVLATEVLGMHLAAARKPVPYAASLLGTALVVGAANALNMYLERHVDGQMERTRDRPLPAGRLAPSTALTFGLLLATLGLPMLAFAVNPLSGLLGAVALVTYVLAYTPLKRVTPLALWVGAVPGAIPPLLGWTSATGSIDRLGLSLFLLLYAWQVPHVIAISVSRVDDYRRAGLHVVPVTWGDGSTRALVLLSSASLVAISLLPWAFGLGGMTYLFAAILLGALWVAFAWRNVDSTPVQATRWAQRLFRYSLAYLVLLMILLALPLR